MWRFPVWKRTIVMAAGSVTHFMLAIVALWLAAIFIGLPNPDLTNGRRRAASTSTASSRLRGRRPTAADRDCVRRHRPGRARPRRPGCRTAT